MPSHETAIVHVDVDMERGARCAVVRTAVHGDRAARVDTDWRTIVDTHCGSVFAFVVDHVRGGATIVPEDSLPNAHIEAVDDGTYTYRLATPGSVPMPADTASDAVRLAFDAIRAWGHQRIAWIREALGETSAPKSDEADH